MTLPNPEQLIPEEYFDLIQQTSLPGVWSKGVSLARSGGILLDSQKPEEMVLRVKSPDHPVSRKVTLWPHDEDWFCDCESKTEVCIHVAATVIYLRKPKPLEGPALGESATQTTTKAAPPAKTARIRYQFTRVDQKLSFARWIDSSEKLGEKKQLLSESLVSWVGGVTSGRVQSLPVAATQNDFKIDAILSGTQRGILDPAVLGKLICTLSDCSNIFLDGVPITTATKEIKLQAELTNEGEGFRLRWLQNPSITETFKNRAILCGTVLKAVNYPPLTPTERELLSGSGRVFAQDRLADLLLNILPQLERKIEVIKRCRNLPQIRRSEPRLVVELDSHPNQDGSYETLTILPKIVYANEDPDNNGSTIYQTDPEAENLLTRKLISELQLNPGQRVTLDGVQAVEFCQRVKNWHGEVTGNGLTVFQIEDPLVADLRFGSDMGLELGSGTEFSFSFSNSKQKSAETQRVLQAWRNQESLIPLIGGGWATLPKDWLNRYGNRILTLLEARENAQNGQKKIPGYFLPELIDLSLQLSDEASGELAQTLSQNLRLLKDRLTEIDCIPEALLPQDFPKENINLRSYQQKGLNWLSFLRDSQMGALLADDMGLGKTLQALCAVRGKTLIITPTSVLPGWHQQLEQYRPSLKVTSYYGSQRKWPDSPIHVVLTSYAILRIDRDLFVKESWDTIVLDEAQMIKNSESQVTRAVHTLRGSFKIALSGTPVENSLRDLWSQFQFLNPGLLGSLQDFQEQFVGPIGRGDSEAVTTLKNRVKPFILRRTKKEVAPELPPRTETILYCELSTEEREVYETVLASARKEVLEKLETSGNVFAALELLLRLRQACCHSALIPGRGTSSSSRSAKLDLLLETLEKSIAHGHRALVFSQWTSYLDLIEPEFKVRGISYNRLDGSTKNRAEVITEFQSDNGPSVMLISLKAGGMGLTLTAADHVFLLDPWWNPAVEDQAADRAHRIGQTNPVLIQRLIAQNTIEDRILALQKTKKNLADALLHGTGTAHSITKEDIIQLLK